MAVHTKLTKEEISSFIQKNYNIGSLISYKEIIDGIDNSNFIIETTQDKFILTLFENRINSEELPFFMNLKLHLAQKTDNHISCPRPILNKSNLAISTIKNKSAAIVSFLKGTTLKPEENGVYSNITINHCQQIGKILANLHESVLDFKEIRQNDLGISGWRVLFAKIENRLDNYQKGLKAEILGYIELLERNWVFKSDLETHEMVNFTKQKGFGYGVVHVDLFPDNVFFDKEDNLSGVIDFYFAANDLFIYDLSVVINAWCFDSKNKFDQAKFNALVESYQKVRKLSQAEIEFFKYALIGAALRFLLTRLYDFFFTPKHSLVKIKNPNEYLEKIKFFLDYKISFS